MADTPQHWASGNWTVSEGREEEFIAAWKDWLGWSSQNIDGFVSATLIREIANPRHFVSFSPWRDAGTRDAWKSSGGFAEKLVLLFPAGLNCPRVDSLKMVAVVYGSVEQNDVGTLFGST